MATPSTAAAGRSRYHGRRMSLAEYEALPAEKPGLEYWDGVVVQKTVPRQKHRRLQRELDTELNLYRRRHGGDSGPEGHIWFEGHGYLLPDVSYWLPSKDHGDEQRSLPPTLAVEIRSPDDSLEAERAKCRNMRANGVDVCWLIDPESRTAERFEGEADGELFPAGGKLASTFLPGFSLPLAELFAALDE